MLPTTVDAPIRQRSAMLPPPLPGEEKVDLELVELVRNGDSSLEEEDAIIQELIDIYNAYESLGGGPYPVYWTPPVLSDDPADAEKFMVGFEIKFLRETGRPVAMTLLSATQDAHGEPIYTKTVPRGLTKPGTIFSALSPNLPSHRQYLDQGFAPSDAKPFLNPVDWQTHMSSVYGDLLQSVQMMDGPKGVKKIFETALAESKEYFRVRRASDPRLSGTEEGENLDPFTS